MDEIDYKDFPLEHEYNFEDQAICTNDTGNQFQLVFLTEDELNLLLDFETQWKNKSVVNMEYLQAMCQIAKIKSIETTNIFHESDLLNILKTISTGFYGIQQQNTAFQILSFILYRISNEDAAIYFTQEYVQSVIRFLDNEHMGAFSFINLIVTKIVECRDYILDMFGLDLIIECALDEDEEASFPFISLLSRICYFPLDEVSEIVTSFLVILGRTKNVESARDSAYGLYLISKNKKANEVVLHPKFTEEIIQSLATYDDIRIQKCFYGILFNANKQKLTISVPLHYLISALSAQSDDAAKIIVTYLCQTIKTEEGLTELLGDGLIPQILDVFENGTANRKATALFLIANLMTIGRTNDLAILMEPVFNLLDISETNLCDQIFLILCSFITGCSNTDLKQNILKEYVENGIEEKIDEIDTSGDTSDSANLLLAQIEEYKRSLSE